eukprot:1186753-Prorocentrum_minimum.AAC.3
MQSLPLRGPGAHERFLGFHGSSCCAINGVGVRPELGLLAQGVCEQVRPAPEQRQRRGKRFPLGGGTLTQPSDHPEGAPIRGSRRQQGLGYKQCGRVGRLISKI